VSSCQSLSSGNTYYLAQDLVAGPGAQECLSVARDVTLDCRGHSIIGSGAGVGISLPGHRYFFTLRNCGI
ncbi:unnamed protein product, partial [Laminaria digitata]